MTGARYQVTLATVQANNNRSTGQQQQQHERFAFIVFNHHWLAQSPEHSTAFAILIFSFHLHSVRLFAPCFHFNINVFALAPNCSRIVAIEANKELESSFSAIASALVHLRCLHYLLRCDAQCISLQATTSSSSICIAVFYYYYYIFRSCVQLKWKYTSFRAGESCRWRCQAMK